MFGVIKKKGAQNITKIRFKLIRLGAPLIISKLLDWSLGFANIINYPKNGKIKVEYIFCR